MTGRRWIRSSIRTPLFHFHIRASLKSLLAKRCQTVWRWNVAKLSSYTTPTSSSERKARSLPFVLPWFLLAPHGYRKVELLSCRHSGLRICKQRLPTACGDGHVSANTARPETCKYCLIDAESFQDKLGRTDQKHGRNLNPKWHILKIWNFAPQHQEFFSLGHANRVVSRDHSWWDSLVQCRSSLKHGTTNRLICKAHTPQCDQSTSNPTGGSHSSSYVVHSLHFWIRICEIFSQTETRIL